MLNYTKFTVHASQRFTVHVDMCYIITLTLKEREEKNDKITEKVTEIFRQRNCRGMLEGEKNL